MSNGLDSYVLQRLLSDLESDFVLDGEILFYEMEEGFGTIYAEIFSDILHKYSDKVK